MASVLTARNTNTNTNEMQPMSKTQASVGNRTNLLQLLPLELQSTNQKICDKFEEMNFPTAQWNSMLKYLKPAKCSESQRLFWYIFGKNIMIPYILLDQYHALGVYLISIGFDKLGIQLIKTFKQQFASVENILKSDFAHLWDGVDNYFTIKTVLLPKRYQWDIGGKNGSTGTKNITENISSDDYYVSLMKQMTSVMNSYCRDYACVGDCYDTWQCKKSGSTTEWLKDIWDSYAFREPKPGCTGDTREFSNYVMNNNVENKTKTFEKLQKSFKLAMYGENRELFSKCYLLFLPPCCYSPTTAYVFQFTQAYTVTIIEIKRTFWHD